MTHVIYSFFFWSELWLPQDVKIEDFFKGRVYVIFIIHGCLTVAD